MIAREQIDVRLSIINHILEEEEMKYAEENGYKTTGLARECYIDGIWNKGKIDIIKL